MKYKHLKTLCGAIWFAFWQAVLLLTTLPTPKMTHIREDLAGYSALFYPVVGAAIGGLLFVVYSVLAGHIDPFLNAAVLLVCLYMFTGAMHLDGYADTLDGYLSRQKSVEKIFEIMKDPRSGSLSVVFVLLLILLKFAAFYVLVRKGDVFVLFCLPVFSRAALLFLVAAMPYKQSAGMGQNLHRQVPKIAAAVWVLLLLFCFAWWWGFWASLCLVAVLGMLYVKILRWIGCATGDVYGFWLEVSELVMLLLWVLLPR